MKINRFIYLVLILVFSCSSVFAGSASETIFLDKLVKICMDQGTLIDLYEKLDNKKSLNKYEIIFQRVENNSAYLLDVLKKDIKKSSRNFNNFYRFILDNKTVEIVVFKPLVKSLKTVVEETFCLSAGGSSEEIFLEKRLTYVELLQDYLYKINKKIASGSLKARYSKNPLRALAKRLAVYYADTKGKKGKDLFLALNKITGRKYKTYQYYDAKKYMYEKIDNKNGKCFAHYSQLWISKKGNRFIERGDANKDGDSGDFINCEHTWPQSMFAKALPMVSDIHHLFPTLSVPNRMRGHLRFGKVKNSEYKTFAGSKLGYNVFEPCNAQKGNTARAMLYFYVRYYNKRIKQKSYSKSFWDNNVATFIKWHKQDPPDEREKLRNDKVEKYQGNRNPFVDVPEFTDMIGTSVFKGM